MKKTAIVLAKVYKILDIIGAAASGICVIVSIAFYAPLAALASEIVNQSESAADAAAGGIVAMLVEIFGTIGLAIFGFLFAILFVICVVGAVCANKLILRINNATSKKDVIGMGICNIIFGNTLAGIFALCIPENQFENQVVEN